MRHQIFPPPARNIWKRPSRAASWGHPETTGLPTIDYYLSAADFEPPNAFQNYTERLVLLPHLGCFYRASTVTPVDPILSHFGLNPAVPICLCPGTPLKYAPEYDRVLIKIAQRLDQCQFVFFTYRLSELSDKLRDRLRRSFADAGLDAERLLRFIPWQSGSQFRGWLRRADVLLDTIGFSGFNTAMQAVECGIPMVASDGKFMRGRLASGILKRMGLPELVAKAEEDYVQIAVRTCRDREYRAHIRDRIEQSRHVLFEDEAPIRALEQFIAGALEDSNAS